MRLDMAHWYFVDYRSNSRGKRLIQHMNYYRAISICVGFVIAFGSASMILNYTLKKSDFTLFSDNPSLIAAFSSLTERAVLQNVSISPNLSSEDLCKSLRTELRFLQRDREVSSVATNQIPSDLYKQIGIEQSEFAMCSALLTNKSLTKFVAVIGVLQRDSEVGYQVIDQKGMPAILPPEDRQKFGLDCLWIRRQPSEPQTNAEDFSFSLDSQFHSFGMTKPFQTYECNVTLKNTGLKLLRINSVRTSCGCTSAGVRGALRLKPGESTVVRINLRTSQDLAIRQTVLIALNDMLGDQNHPDSEHLIGFPVFANQEASMQIAPSALNLGIIDRSPNASIDRIVRLSETPTDRFEINKVSMGKTPLTYKLRTINCSNGLRNYLINFSMNPSHAQLAKIRVPDGDAISDSITIETTSHLVPRVSIPVEFRLPPRVVLTPSIISFGSPRVGVKVQEHVFLALPPRSLSRVVEIRPTADFSAVCTRIDDSRFKVQLSTSFNKAGVTDGIVKCIFECDGETLDVGIPWVATVVSSGTN